jgi:glycosyl transferase family 10 (putative fucosyltransferase)
MTSVFFADPMNSTPFTERHREKALSREKLSVARSAPEADVIVARRMSALLPLFDLKKRYYVWSHEPMYAPIGERYIRDLATGVNVAVSSAFNGDVYLTPLYYFVYDPVDLDQVIAKARRKTELCSFLATYRKDQAKYIGGTNADLAFFRQSMALYLQSRGMCKIYGRDWPEGITVEGESRGEGWHQAKRGILAAYTYNIAVENTVAHNYVTEKHWDATQAGCVQVYFAAGSGVEAVTPPGAIIDCSRGSTFDDVAERMRMLTQSEREGMLEAAVAAINRTGQVYQRPAVIGDMVARFAERVRELLEVPLAG